MVDFKAAAAQTYRNIRTLNVTATFVVVSGGSYNPETGTWSGETSTSVAVPSTPPVGYSVFHKTESSTKEGISVVLIPGHELKFVPKIGQRFTIGQEQWQIMAFKKHAVGEVVFAYELEASIG